MKFKTRFMLLVSVALLLNQLSFAEGSKEGWQLELKKIAINFTSTEVQNAEIYKASGISNARLTSDSQTLIQGTFNFAADYFAPKSFWSNTLLMEYGKTYIRPVGKDEVINESADKILLTTDYTYRLWKVENFLGGFEAGPFANIGYETEFSPQDNTPLKKIVRGMAGAKLFEGKYLKSLYISAVGEADYTYTPETTKFAMETGFKLENPIREGLKVVSFGYYRNYMKESTERITDLQYELELDVRLDVMLYKNLSLAPFINYYTAQAKHFSGKGENLYTGLSLTYSTFFKKAEITE